MTRVAREIIDGYDVTVHEDAAGKFYVLIDGVRYAGASQKTPELALERAKKLVAARQAADAKARARQNVDIDARVADAHFKHERRTR